MKRNYLFFSALLIVCLLFIASSGTAQAQQLFLHDLRLGAIDSDVQRLQIYLNGHGATVASSGPGSSGNETQYFGPATARAVSHFQELHADAILFPSNLTKGTGQFYSATRNFVNKTLGQIMTSSTSSNTYYVGGMITGITGPTTLQNNTDVITINPGQSANFHFPTKLKSGQSYSLNVTQTSNSQHCFFAPGQSGSGIVQNSDVSITIQCSNNGMNPFTPLMLSSSAATYTIGGTVSGLSGTLVLQNNGGNADIISSNGTFTFSNQLAEGNPYNVTVQTQPSGQTCVVTNGSGTMGGSNVTNVSISCSVALLSIAVTPSNSHLPTTINEQFTATGYYADLSTRDITALMTWDTSNHSVATINSTGLAIGVASGTTQVNASLSGVLGTTYLIVTDAVLVSIAILPPNPAIARDATIQFSALGTFSDGSTADITNQATWTSTITNVATVNNTDHKGQATGVSGGVTIIHADFNSVTGTVTLFAGN